VVVPLIVAAAENENPLVPAGGEIIIAFIAFGVLVLLLMKTAFPRAEKAYRDRRDAIEGGMERAARAQQEAQQALEQYRAQLADARQEAGRIREQANADAAAIKREMEERVAAEREERLRAFAEQLAQQRAQAVAQLRMEVGSIAMELAERIVGHELTGDQRQHELVDDFIAGLEAAPVEADASAAAPTPAGS
jgi:F-type H+-transporting ATPase subunit b